MNYSEAIKIIHGFVYAYTHILVLLGIFAFIAALYAVKAMGDDQQSGMQRQGSNGSIAVTSAAVGVGLIYFQTVINNTTQLTHGKILYGDENPLSWTASGAVNIAGSQEVLAGILLVAFFQAAGVFAMGSGFSSFQDSAELYGTQRRQSIKTGLAKLIAGSFMLIPDSFVGMFGPIIPAFTDLSNSIADYRLI